MRPARRASSVVAALESARDAVVISVHDDGPGIEPADAESVFEPFWRGATGGGRSGLGLAIARGFALANGGTLRVGADRTPVRRWCSHSRPAHLEPAEVAL